MTITPVRPTGDAKLRSVQFLEKMKHPKNGLQMQTHANGIVLNNACGDVALYDKNPFKTL